jgi:ubiquinone/menaquinone biosynthesis C-methylase UbiE
LIVRSLGGSQLNKATPIGAGKSSFELIDSNLLFRELNLKAGMTVLDLACGKGAYSLAASEQVGASGTVFAVDLWEDGIAMLKQEAESRGIQNITALVGNAGRRIPVADGSIDLCLMSTVLHDFVQDGVVSGVLKETVRVLKPGGLLSINEFKKIEGPPGPPITVRLAPEDVKKILSDYDFKKGKITTIGPYNYLMLFNI